MVETSKGVKSKEPIAETKDLYAKIQKACLATAIFHTLAVLSSINLYRTGDLSNFSIHRLMNFVAFNPDLWRLNNLLVATSAISALYLFVCLVRLAYKEKIIQSIFLLSLVIMAVAIQINSQTSLMIYFYDCSAKYVFDPTANKSLLAHEGWKSVNQTIAHIFVCSSALYGLAGLKLSNLLLRDNSLSKWIGWSGVFLWSSALLISLSTLFSFLPWTVLFILVATIAYIIWTISIYVNIDGNKQKQEHGGENQTTNQI